MNYKRIYERSCKNHGVTDCSGQLTDVQKGNYLKLLNYLKEHRHGLPIELDMSTFLKNYSISGALNVSEHECATAGCALGISLFAGIPSEEDLHNKGLEWENYTTKYFGVKYSEDPLWFWVFDGFWADFLDQLEGVIARIELIKKDFIVPTAVDL